MKRYPMMLAGSMTAGLVFLAGCGSSGGGQSTAKAGSSGPALTKSPIVIASMSSEQAAQGNQLGLRPALNAIVAYDNAHGGINGHPVKLQFCDHKLDPNLLTQCTQGVLGAKAVAMIDPYINIPSYIAALDRAGIPSIEGAFVVGQPALQSADSFPVDAGAGSISYGQADLVKKRGYADISMVVSASPGTAPVSEAFKTGAATDGLHLGHDIVVPLTLTDMSSVVAQAKGADAIYLLLPPTQMLAFLQAEKQAGVTKPLIVQSGLLQQSYIDDTGGAASPAEGALVGDYLPAGSDPAWAEYRKAIGAYSGNKSQIDLDNSLDKAAWASMEVFRSVAQKIPGPVTAASMLQALKTSSSVSLGTGLPTLDFTKTFCSASAPRLFNRQVYPITVKGGKFVSDGSPVDVSSHYAC